MRKFLIAIAAIGFLGGTSEAAHAMTFGGGHGRGGGDSRDFRNGGHGFAANGFDHELADRSFGARKSFGYRSGRFGWLSGFPGHDPGHGYDWGDDGVCPIWSAYYDASNCYR